jgi:hypothetical protein
MHPEILRELTAQRRREMQARARRGRLARMAIRAARRGRHLPDEAEESVLPQIPDYVDGSFRADLVGTEPAGDQVASEAGRAPAGRHAA